MPGRPLEREPTPEPEEAPMVLENVTYYNWEECYQEWQANPQPAEAGYSFPDLVVQSLVAERDHVREENQALETDNQVLQHDAQRLQGIIEGLRAQVAGLEVDQVHMKRRLKYVTQKSKVLEVQKKLNNAFIDNGLKLLKEAFETFEHALTDSDSDESSGPATSGTSGMVVPVAARNEERNVGAEGEPSTAPAAELGPYTGWVYGGNYA